MNINSYYFLIASARTEAKKANNFKIESSCQRRLELIKLIASHIYSTMEYKAYETFWRMDVTDFFRTLHSMGQKKP